MKNYINTIFARIFLVSSAICAIFVIAGATFAYKAMERSIERNAEQILRDSVSFIQADIQAGVNPQKLALAIQKYSANSGIRTTIIKNDGKVLLDSKADNASMQNHLNRREVKDAFDGKTTVNVRYSQTLGARLMYVAASATQSENAKNEYCVRQSIKLSVFQSKKDGLKIAIFSIGAVAVLFSVMLSYITAKRISKPLKLLAQSAAKYAAGDFEHGTPHSNIREIGELSKSLYIMGRNLKKRINSLHKRNCELDEIFSQLNECVFICSDNNDVRRYNKSCAETFGIAENEQNLRVAEAFRNSAILRAIGDTFKNGENITREIEHLNKTYILTGLLLPYKAKHARALFVMRDISKEKQNEILRKEFVAGASHELKTPITAIKMAAETVADNYDEETAKRFLPTIEKEASRMANIVDDMILLSKVEFSANNPQFEKFNLSDTVKIAANNYDNQIMLNGDTLTNLCPENLEIFGDEKLVQIALNNLISNAVRYGGKNCKITITGAQDGNFVKITVADTGIGISKDDLPRVFERFFRVDKGRSRELGGTGLGLALVKHIAILHKGTVYAESEQNKGSRFTITFRKAK